MACMIASVIVLTWNYAAADSQTLYSIHCSLCLGTTSRRPARGSEHYFGAVAMAAHSATICMRDLPGIYPEFGMTEI